MLLRKVSNLDAFISIYVLKINYPRQDKHRIITVKSLIIVSSNLVYNLPEMESYPNTRLLKEIEDLSSSTLYFRWYTNFCPNLELK
jgi:hypothetical protein